MKYTKEEKSFKEGTFRHAGAKTKINPGVLFVLPSLIGCLIFIFIPSIWSFALSFSDWNLIGAVKFAGLDNYIELLSQKEFWEVAKNTVIYAASTTIFATIIPLILAAMLFSQIKHRDFFKTIYFLPFITPMIVTAMLWQQIFDPNTGIVNALLNLDIKWLYDENTALWVLIFVTVWKQTGYNMVIFLTGFSTISKDTHEAAEIDGANAITEFTKITVPLLSPTIFFVILITAVSSFQVFDLIYLMTEGGPGNSTNVLVYWLYKNAFEYFDIGKASAIAYILFVMIFSLTIIQWKTRKKWVLNEKD